MISSDILISQIVNKYLYRAYIITFLEIREIKM